MKNLKKNLIYTFLFTFLLTSCIYPDMMVVTEVKLNNTHTEKGTYRVTTTASDFKTDTNYRVGDTLYYSKNNCK